METHEPLFRQIQFGDEIIDCPATEHEWLYPEEYVGKNIMWYMAKHIYLEDFVSNDTINKFFRIYDNWKLLEHILSVATGHEYLTTIDNARDHITDLDLQEPLIRCLLYKSNSGVYDVFVKMTKDPNLKTIRHNIWNFLK